MKFSQSKQILFILLLTAKLFSQNCTEIEPDQFGDCQEPLGYGWTGVDCQMISGCNNGQELNNIFTTYEECIIICENNFSLGDLNGDSVINIIDIVQLLHPEII